MTSPSTARSSALAVCIALAVPAPPQALTQAEFERLWAHVLPEPDELEWRRIPWRIVLTDAVLEAQQADKPVLLWAMNGHPLGCT
jgi:hypothetical protein